MSLNNYILLLLSMYSMYIGKAHAQISEIYNQPVDNDYLERLNEVFFERGRTDPKYLMSIEPGLFVKANSTTTIKFLGEGAGYKNRFGYYEISSQNEKHTIFQNASGSGFGLSGGGDLNVGDSVDIQSTNYDRYIGFWLHGNGYNNPRGHYYYSDSSLNPDGIDHMAMVYDPVTTELAFGFEDLYKGGDRDYNDILFSVANSEEDSIKTDATESMVKNTTVLKDLAEANGMVTMFIERYANVNILEDVILYQQDFSTQLNVPFKGHAYVSVETNSQISLNTLVSNLSGYNGLDLPVNWQYSNGSQTYFSNPGASKTVEIITLETTLDDVTKLPAGQKLTGQLIVTIYPLF